MGGGTLPPAAKPAGAQGERRRPVPPCAPTPPTRQAALWQLGGRAGPRRSKRCEPRGQGGRPRLPCCEPPNALAESVGSLAAARTHSCAAAAWPPRKSEEVGPRLCSLKPGRAPVACSPSSRRCPPALLDATPGATSAPSPTARSSRSGSSSGQAGAPPRTPAGPHPQPSPHLRGGKLGGGPGAKAKRTRTCCDPHHRAHVREHGVVDSKSVRLPQPAATPPHNPTCAGMRLVDSWKARTTKLRASRRSPTCAGVRSEGSYDGARRAENRA